MGARVRLGECIARSPSCTLVNAHKSMPAECPERRRLARKVAETVGVVYELKDRQREAGNKNDAAVTILWIKPELHNGMRNGRFTITSKSMDVQHRRCRLEESQTNTFYASPLLPPM